MTPEDVQAKLVDLALKRNIKARFLKSEVEATNSRKKRCQSGASRRKPTRCTRPGLLIAVCHQDLSLSLDCPAFLGIPTAATEP
jgi:hypothetical protein